MDLENAIEARATGMVPAFAFYEKLTRRRPRRPGKQIAKTEVRAGPPDVAHDRETRPSSRSQGTASGRVRLCVIPMLSYEERQRGPRVAGPRVRLPRGHRE